MEEINIAEILKDKPKGTKLYSPIFGEVELWSATPILEVKPINDMPYMLSVEGRFCSKGEVMLFPSNKMRDWTKFAWKKGDVLIDEDANFKCIFESWANDEYTKINVRHHIDCRNGDYLKQTKELTKKCYKALDSCAKIYLKAIEERFGGKLNIDTLEIENPTSFNTFDKVLVRDGENGTWHPAFFSRIVDPKNNFGSKYAIMNGDTELVYGQCIPYEGNEHLVFTTESV